MEKLKEGDVAPTFSGILDQEGNTHSLADSKGKWVLLYFYPKDNTPGCTKEACAIRDEYPQFKNLDCVVFGVSADTESKHANFAEKFALPFTLLADTEKEIIKKYGVWALKKMMGREYMGILRTSFLINPEGKIAKVYEKVKPVEHAQEVLQDIEALKKN